MPKFTLLKTGLAVSIKKLMQLDIKRIYGVPKSKGFLQILDLEYWHPHAVSLSENYGAVGHILAYKVFS